MPPLGLNESLGGKDAQTHYQTYSVPHSTSEGSGATPENLAPEEEATRKARINQRGCSLSRWQTYSIQKPYRNSDARGRLLG